MNKGVINYILAVLLCAFSFFSCGALFMGTTQTVSIKSFPQGSTIEVDGTTDLTPAMIELQRNNSYVVTISKEGYETQQVKIGQKVNVGIVVLDILGGLVPLIIDAAMGTWNNLEPKEITVNLTSKQTGALDIPVKMVLTEDEDVFLKVVSPQTVQIQIKKAE